MYNKIFSKILDSSIWLEPETTRIVWITMLAAMDEDGFVQMASVPNLARRANVDTESCARAVAVLEAPDENSSNPKNEGRRIERVPGGWLVLNAADHREIITRENSKETNRRNVRAHRERKALQNSKLEPVLEPVRDCNSETITCKTSGSVSDTDQSTERSLDQGTDLVLRSPEEKIYVRSTSAAKVAKQSAHRELMTLYHDLHLDRFGVKPTIGKAEGQTLANLLKQHAPEDIAECLRMFFADDDDWLRKTGWTMGVFYSQFPKLNIRRKNPEIAIAAPELPHRTRTNIAAVRAGSERRSMATNREALGFLPRDTRK